MMSEFCNRLHEIRYRRFHPEEKQQSGYFPTPKTQKLITVKSTVSTFCSSRDLSTYDKIQTLNQLAAKLSKC